MRVIFLCKRLYMRKDVIDDRYGRLYELPRQLARRGHEVLGICLSYRPRPEINVTSEPGLTWRSLNLGRTLVVGGIRYFRLVEKSIQDFRPDILVGSSDCPHVIMTAGLARHLGIPYIIDLYDNYESFGLSHLPGILPLYRQALAKASGISCVSRRLAGYIQAGYQPIGPVITLESVVDTTLFRPLDREFCRATLKLPIDAELVGVVGALDEDRGIDVLYRAHTALATSGVRAHLVLAGTPSSRCPIPQSPDVHFLGAIEHRLMPVLLNALDTAVIPMRDTAFGRYAFPQKLYEILACRVPVVAAAVGAIEDLLADYPDCLYTPDDPDNLRDRIAFQLMSRRPVPLPIPDWADQAALLETLLQEAFSV